MSPVDSGEDQPLATCWSSAGDAASDRADPRSPLSLGNGSVGGPPPGAVSARRQLALTS
jgi:hypothetical protein